MVTRKFHTKDLEYGFEIFLNAGNNITIRIEDESPESDIIGFERTAPPVLVIPIEDATQMIEVLTEIIEQSGERNNG